MKSFVADSNYHQFYVADLIAEPDAPDIWTEQDVAAHHVTLENISALSPESDIDARITSCGPSDDQIEFPDSIGYEVRVTIKCPSRSVGIYGWPWELEDEYEIGSTSCDILFRAFLTEFKDDEKDYYYVHVMAGKG